MLLVYLSKLAWKTLFKISNSWTIKKSWTRKRYPCTKNVQSWVVGWRRCGSESSLGRRQIWSKHTVTILKNYWKIKKKQISIFVQNDTNCLWTIFMNKILKISLKERKNYLNLYMKTCGTWRLLSQTNLEILVIWIGTLNTCIKYQQDLIRHNIVYWF